MDSIRIRNLRSLKDTGYINIRPLTILVGKNSSGKSTFLRFFPLMKQTLSTKKNEPILWYSAENVDFGSFKESINRKSSEKVIGFDFKFNISDYFRNLNIENNLPISLNVDLTEKSLKRISFNVFESNIEIVEYSENSYKVLLNNQEVDKIIEVNNRSSYESFLPKFVIKSEEEDNQVVIDKLINKIPIAEYFKELLFERIVSKNYKDDKEFQSRLRSDFKFFSEELTISNLLLIAKRDRGFINKIRSDLKNHQVSIEKWIEIKNEDRLERLYGEYLDENETEENLIIETLKSVSDEEYIEYNNLLLGIYIVKLIDLSNDYLKSYFSQVHYIAPLRASAQRYYRRQGVAVDEIDPQGENIPMAINHMSSNKKSQFKRWMKMNFGFEIETKEDSGGHVTLNISFNEKENLNLADTGFGFSQVLPILLLLWRVENREINHGIPRVIRYMRYFNTHTIVIEQPELHLHPALQARLTDALVKCIEKANKKNINLNIILETHSETIINRVGQQIYKEKINKDIINVLIFGDLEGQSPSESCLTSVNYNEEGTIENWPLGFFYPED